MLAATHGRASEEIKSAADAGEGTGSTRSHAVRPGAACRSFTSGNGRGISQCHVSNSEPEVAGPPGQDLFVLIGEKLGIKQRFYFYGDLHPPHRKA